MKRLLHGFLCGFALTTAGCFHSGVWVHSQFPQQTIETAPLGTAKLPVTVVVVADPTLTREIPFDWQQQMNPGFAGSVRNAFTGYFDDVTISQDPHSSGNADLLAVPTLEFSLFKTPLLLRDPEELVVTFVDQRTGDTITTLQASRMWDLTAPGAQDYLIEDLAWTAVDFVPVVGSWVTPYVARTAARHDLDRYNAGLGSALRLMLRDIDAQIPYDPKLKSFAIRKRTARGLTSN